MSYVYLSETNFQDNIAHLLNSNQIKIYLFLWKLVLGLRRPIRQLMFAILLEDNFLFYFFLLFLEDIQRSIKN